MDPSRIAGSTGSTSSRVVGVCAALLLSACGGSGQRQCSADNCSGCCDGNICRAGDGNQSCGAGGAVCSACAGGSQCVEHRCVAPAVDAGTDAGAVGCAGACLAGQQCVAGACVQVAAVDAGSSSFGWSVPGNPGESTEVAASWAAGAGNCGAVTSAGRCASSTSIEYCAAPTGTTAAPSLQTHRCTSGESCQVRNGQAGCVPAGQCRTGSSRCATASLLQECTAGAWTQTTCAAGTRCVESGWGDFCTPALATRKVNATLKYEARRRYSDFSNWEDPPTVFPAYEILVLSLRGGTVVDAVNTGEDGTFSIDIPAAPAAGDRVVFLTVQDNGEGGLGYAVADPGFGQAGSKAIGTLAKPYLWQWEVPSSDIVSGEVYQIDESNGSAALYVYSWLRFVAKEVERMTGRPGKSIVIWLGMGTSWNCGKCFAVAPTELLGMTLDSQLWISADSDMAYYSEAVIVHELGHWVMSSYGTSPDELGPHMIGVPTFPGQAWSEGFATWFSSAMRGSQYYFDKQQGGMFSVDLAARSYSQGTKWIDPEAAIGMNQMMDENEVAAMSYRLASSATQVKTFLDAVASSRLNTAPFGRMYTKYTWGLDAQFRPVNVVNTGVSKPMFADVLDALMCGGVSRATIDAVTVPATRFPYPSSSPICAGSGAASSGTVTKAADGLPCIEGTQCASALCVLNNASQTQGTCRSPCTPGGAACAGGDGCMPLATGGACVPPPSSSSRWTLYFASAQLVSTNPQTRAAWDAPGAPDPFACALTSSVNWVCTAALNDTLTPAWNTPTADTYAYSDLAYVRFDLYDQDAANTADVVDIYEVDMRCPFAGYTCGGQLLAKDFPAIFPSEGFPVTGTNPTGSTSLTVWAVPQ